MKASEVRLPDRQLYNPEKYPGVLLREISRMPGVSVASVTMNYGATYPRHFHKTSTEIYVIAMGSGRVYLEEPDGHIEQVRFQEGDTVRIPAGTTHSIEVVNQDGCGMVVLYSFTLPAYSVDDTVYLEEKTILEYLSKRQAPA